MECPCCGRDCGDAADTINQWSKTARAYEYAWSVYRCSWCMGDSEEENAPQEECSCGGYCNDGPNGPSGYGCDL